MRSATVICLTAAVMAPTALAAPAAAAPSPGTTALRIVTFADGSKPATRIVRWLRCDPPRGTLPRPAAACRALARTGRATLLPVPADRACTELYGGPQVAIVTGLVDDRRVWARLRRDDGCQIARWERNGLLVAR